jgi:ferredoxin
MGVTSAFIHRIWTRGYETGDPIIAYRLKHVPVLIVDPLDVGPRGRIGLLLFGESRGEGVLMKVSVDLDQCEANGICVGIAPDVFELDDEDVLHIAEGEVPADRVAEVEDAVAQCPKAALKLL